MEHTLANMEQQERIRVLFLHPSESYALREVATLTATPVRKLRREVATGDRDAAKVCGRWRCAWRQAVYVALQRWTLAEIEDALGADAAAVLPPLLTLRTVTVRLPEYIVRALEVIAAEDQTTVDAALGYELIEFAGCHHQGAKGVRPSVARNVEGLPQLRGVQDHIGVNRGDSRQSGRGCRLFGEERHPGGRREHRSINA
jgi:hypothetical protein